MAEQRSNQLDTLLAFEKFADSAKVNPVLVEQVRQFIKSNYAGRNGKTLKMWNFYADTAGTDETVSSSQQSVIGVLVTSPTKATLQVKDSATVKMILVGNPESWLETNYLGMAFTTDLTVAIATGSAAARGVIFTYE